MIVQSMTPEEVYREIDQDMPDVAAWWLREAFEKNKDKLLSNEEIQKQIKRIYKL